MGFVDPPGPIARAHLAADPLIQNRRIALDPAPDRDVVNSQVPLRHNLLQVAIRERVSQVPANAQEDDHILEVPPAEQRRPFSGHDIPYQSSSIAFATEPSCSPPSTGYALRRAWRI